MLKTTLGIEKPVLFKLGEERLLDFEALRAAGRFHSAIYMAGYAVEAFLKCCICKRLDCDKLPRIYELHELKVLLFFSGLRNELIANANVKLAFDFIDDRWLDAGIRYDDPAARGYNAQTCDDFNSYLNDPKNGVIPWLKSQL